MADTAIVWRLKRAAQAGGLRFLGMSNPAGTHWSLEEPVTEEVRKVAFHELSHWLLPTEVEDSQALSALLELLEASLPPTLSESSASLKVADSRELLLKLTEKSPGAFFQFEKRPDGSLAFPFLSKGIEDIHPGLTIEALQEDPRLGFSQMHPEDLPEIMKKLSLSYRELTPWDYEFRVIQGDKEEWHRALAQPELKEDGTVVWYGSFQDITEQKKRYFALEARNEQLKEIAWLQSHVIRAPVARLMGLVEVLEMEGISDEERSVMMEAILASAHEIDAVVKEISEKTIREED